MKPEQLAKLECANWMNGSCCGDDAHHDQCKLTLDEPCAYFDDCVLPYGLYITDERRRKLFYDVAQQYRELSSGGGKPCPDCGAVKEPRRRYCVDCRIKRRNLTLKLAKRKSRQACQQLRP